MEFNELLTLDDKDEQTLQLRRAFAPYTATLDVTGNETLALITMVNLTLKRADVTD